MEPGMQSPGLAQAAPSLRAAHRALTRERIRDAAKSVFQAGGVAGATMEQIASAAGVSRPTVYAHFRDKEEVIADVVAAYARASQDVNLRLPGPSPELHQIRAWLEEKVEFYRREQVSLALLYQAGHSSERAPKALGQLMDQVLEAYAERLPVFRVVLQDGPHQPHARVRAEMLVRQITAACEFCARDGAAAKQYAALDVTAEAVFELIGRFEEVAARLHERP
jgi:AcrR family transcriptional regulator